MRNKQSDWYIRPRGRDWLLPTATGPVPPLQKILTWKASLNSPNQSKEVH